MVCYYCCLIPSYELLLTQVINLYMVHDLQTVLHLGLVCIVYVKVRCQNVLVFVRIINGIIMYDYVKLPKLEHCYPGDNCLSIHLTFESRKNNKFCIISFLKADYKSIIALRARMLIRCILLLRLPTLVDSYVMF